MGRNGLDITGSSDIDIGGGLWALLPATLTVADHEGYDVRAKLDATPEGIGVVELTLVRRPGGPVIDPTSLRRIRLGEVVKDVYEQAFASAVQLPTEHPERRELNPLAGLIDALRPVVRPGENGRYALPDDATLWALGMVHNACTLAGIPAQRFLMEQFQLPRATANYWIGQARKRGFLLERDRLADGESVEGVESV